MSCLLAAQSIGSLQRRDTSGVGGRPDIVEPTRSAHPRRAAGREGRLLTTPKAAPGLRALTISSVALGYNICLGVIGGLTPLAATWLVERTADETAPAFLIMAAAAVSFLSVLQFRETYRVPFTGASAAAAAAPA
jgi:hypothetical protein